MIKTIFIIITIFGDAPVFVNPDHIVSFGYQGNSEAQCTVVMDDDTVYDTVESCEDINRMIRNARLRVPKE